MWYGAARTRNLAGCRPPGPRIQVRARGSTTDKGSYPLGDSNATICSDTLNGPRKGQPGDSHILGIEVQL